MKEKTVCHTGKYHPTTTLHGGALLETLGRKARGDNTDLATARECSYCCVCTAVMAVVHPPVFTSSPLVCICLSLYCCCAAAVLVFAV